MKIRLPPSLQQRLKDELTLARHREVGGLLMGEHLGGDDYRIIDLSVQRAGGTAVCFIRHPKKHRAHLDQFFERTGHNYTRFNYLGEWHSHPSFPTAPSGPDLRTMQALARDPAVGANFLVLLIVGLGSDASLRSSATIFRADHASSPAELIIEATEMPPAPPKEMMHTSVDASKPEEGDTVVPPGGHAVHDREGD
jgi:integrative and conjugative element protein (TIGR02256 family)